MKNLRQRPVKTAGYNFSKQSARRDQRRKEAMNREAAAANDGPRPAFGLRQQIAESNNAATIRGIHANGIIRFTFASEQTRRQWSATAKRRIQQLTNQR